MVGFKKVTVTLETHEQTRSVGSWTREGHKLWDIHVLWVGNLSRGILSLIKIIAGKIQGRDKK